MAIEDLSIGRSIRMAGTGWSQNGCWNSTTGLIGLAYLAVAMMALGVTGNPLDDTEDLDRDEVVTDLCPNEWGPPWNFGCPEDQEVVRVQSAGVSEWWSICPDGSRHTNYTDCPGFRQWATFRIVYFDPSGNWVRTERASVEEVAQDEDQLADDPTASAKAVMRCIDVPWMNRIFDSVSNFTYQDMSDEDHWGRIRYMFWKPPHDAWRVTFFGIAFDDNKIANQVASLSGVDEANEWQIYTHGLLHEFRHGWDALQCVTAANLGLIQVGGVHGDLTKEKCWEYLRPAMLADGFSDMEDWVDSRAMKDFKWLFNARSPFDRYYRAADDGNPECLPGA